MEALRIVATDEARQLIAADGGRLYVRLRKPRCCGAATTLVTRTTTDDPQSYRSLGVDAGFELFVPQGLLRLPDELHVDVRRRPRRVEAYWDGCAWVV